MKKGKEFPALPEHITFYHLESWNDISRLYMILNNSKNDMTQRTHSKHEAGKNLSFLLEKYAFKKTHNCFSS